MRELLLLFLIAAALYSQFSIKKRSANQLPAHSRQLCRPNTAEHPTSQNSPGAGATAIALTPGKFPRPREGPFSPVFF